MEMSDSGTLCCLVWFLKETQKMELSLRVSFVADSPAVHSYPFPPTAPPTLPERFTIQEWKTKLQQNKKTFEIKYCKPKRFYMVWVIVQVIVTLHLESFSSQAVRSVRLLNHHLIFMKQKYITLQTVSIIISCQKKNYRTQQTKAGISWGILKLFSQWLPLWTKP